METTDLVSVNRENAGIMLAQKLTGLDHANAIVVGIPHGGVCVAAQVAEHLHLPLEVIMCRKIKDPSDKSKTIGSVSANDVIMHDVARSIPQDYVYFQTIRLRNEIKYEYDFYYGSEPPLDLEYKTVIIVDDILVNADTLLAAIQEVRKRSALRVIVAVPFVQTEAARIIQSETDGLVFLKMQQHIRTPLEYYREFPEVKEWTVRKLLEESKKSLTIV